MKLKFTPIESEILRHRLQMSDSMYEVMLDSIDEVPWTLDQVDERAAKLCQTEGIEFDLSNDLDRWMLEDCVDGSTFVANIAESRSFGEISKGMALAYFKAAKTIEKKLEDAGIPVTFPTS
jgi:hypothetical protein